MLKHLLNKIKELLDIARKWNSPTESPTFRVRYTSVPVWKPWRDY